ncbi:DUF896 domain-containing protein [Peribacillus butanolivorans]
MIEILNRINTLAKKHKEDALTQAELKERKELRQEYLQIIRGQVTNTVIGLTVLDPLGNDVTPEKLKKEQQKQSFKKNDDA